MPSADEVRQMAERVFRLIEGKPIAIVSWHDALAKNFHVIDSCMALNLVECEDGVRIQLYPRRQLFFGFNEPISIKFEERYVVIERVLNKRGDVLRKVVIIC